MWELEEDSDEGEEEQLDQFDSEGLEAALVQLQEIASSPTLRPESFSPEVLHQVTSNTSSAARRSSARSASAAHAPSSAAIDDKLTAVSALAASLSASLSASHAAAQGVIVNVRHAQGPDPSQLKRGGAAAVSAIFASPRNAFVVVGERDGKGSSLIVDPRFRDAFRVTPATRTYGALVDALPEVFIGSPQQLRRMVKLLAAQIARSYSALGLVTPPWRRQSALLARWLPSTFTDTRVYPEDPFAFGSMAGGDNGSEVVWRPPPARERSLQGGNAGRVKERVCLPKQVVIGFAVSSSNAS